MSSGQKDNERRSGDDSTNPRPEAVGYGADTGADDSEKLVLAAPDSATSLRDVSLWAGIFFLLSLTVFSPALRGDFLWDDDRHVSQNLALRSTDGLAKLWVPKTTPQYYPLTHTFFWLQYQVAERSDGTINTLVFHLANILIHAAGATLLWFILRRLQVPGAWLAAAVFAVHPVQVESVAWISELKNVLSGAFFFGSILAYLRFARLGIPVLQESQAVASDQAEDKPRWDLYGLSILLFACALLSKSVTCAMPAVVLILLWWKRGRIAARDAMLLAPFFVLGLAMAAMTVWMEDEHVIGTHAASGDWNLGAARRILIAGHAVWFYLSKLLLPTDLTFIYPKWDIQGAGAVQWLYPAAVVLVLGLLWALRERIGRAPLAAGLIYVGMLVPALGFINVYPMRYSYVADHFQYHAAAAMIALVVGLLATLAQRLFPEPEADLTVAKKSNRSPEQPGPSPAPYILGAVLVLTLSLVAWRHAQAFDSAISLWEDTVEKNPRSWMAYNNLSGEYYALGLAYRQQGNGKAGLESLQSALGAAEKAIEIKADHTNAWINRGLALEAMGRDDEALRSYQRAASIDPTSVDAHFNQGLLLNELERFEEALRAYDAAIAQSERAHPASERSRFIVAKGKTLARLGRDFEAEGAYLRAIELAPKNLDAHYNYGVLLGKQFKRKEAVDQFLHVLRNDPRHLDAKITLAYLQMEVNNMKGAQTQLAESTAIVRQSGQLPPQRLIDAVKEWDLRMRAIDAAATRPSTTQTTQSTTRPAPSSTTRTTTTHPATSSARPATIAAPDGAAARPSP